MRHFLSSLARSLGAACRDVWHLARPHGAAEWRLWACLALWFAALATLWLAYGDAIGSLMGYDSNVWLTERLDIAYLREWSLRHPLLCLFYAPWSLLSKAIDGSSFVYLCFTLNVVWLSLAGLCVFKLLRRWGVRTAAAAASAALYASLACVMLLAWQVESFALSLFLLPLSLLMLTGTRRTATDNLMFMLLAGVTLTNGAKLLLAFCVAERSVRGGVRRAVRAVPLFLASIAVYAPLLAYRIIAKHQDVLFTLLFDSTGYSKPLFSLTNRMEALFSNFFAEAVLFHFRSLAAVTDAPLLPFYGNLACYAVLAIVAAAVLTSVWKLRHETVTALFAAYLAIDILVNFVLGYGIDEAHIFAAHYVFFIPLFAGLLSICKLGGGKRLRFVMRYGVFLTIPFLLWHNGTTLSATLSDFRPQPSYSAELSHWRAKASVIMPHSMPRIFFFGMGNREKYVYRHGALLRLGDSATVFRAPGKCHERIVPEEYRVELAAPGGRIAIAEDERGVWIDSCGERRCLAGTSAALRLPRFEGKVYARVLRVLHHEMLINIRHGAPLPCLLTYDAPFYRDAAMVALCLERTGNERLLLPWLRRVNTLYDYQAGVAEPDNLGELLYMLNMFPGFRPRLREAIMDEARRRLVAADGRWHLTGTTDGGPQPQYQTDWLLTALYRGGQSLTAADGRTPLPLATDINHGDDYAELSHFARVEGWRLASRYRTKTRLRTRLHDARIALREALAPRQQEGCSLFPYLEWARSNYFSTCRFAMLSASYPLSWEQSGALSHAERMAFIDPKAAEDRMCYPHSWTAAEMFLRIMRYNAGSR